MAMVILGISIGTKRTGIAVIKNGSLVRWDTHTLRGKWSEKKIASIIARCENHFKTLNVSVIVIKAPPFTHHSDNIMQLLKSLYAFIEYKGCLVDYKTKEDIKKIVPIIKNTHDLVTFAVTLYPQLQPEQAQEQANKNHYYVKMFEAVVVAHLYHEQRIK
jgi:hypothetical protein